MYHSAGVRFEFDHGTRKNKLGQVVRPKRPDLQ